MNEEKYWNGEELTVGAEGLELLERRDTRSPRFRSVLRTKIRDRLAPSPASAKSPSPRRQRDASEASAGPPDKH